MPTEALCHTCGLAVLSGARFCQHCGSDVALEPGQVATQQWAAPRSTPHLTAYDLLRQDTLGEYEILAELGRGGMATVYLAHDIPLDRKVAIKVMSTASLDEGMAERFRREARTAAALNHPHIIPVYAVRERSGLLYFVMKFIPGQSLDPIIKSRPMSIPMAHVILSQAAAALGYAHRRGVIHRDVKPANIMLDDEGWTVMTDFGIAKVASATGLTMTGVTVGTPAYMSPEQCAGKDVTGASDQYSLGIVAYEMLTGRKPFLATTAMAMMYAHFNEAVAPIRSFRPDCPADLEMRILRMLEKEPEQRWPSIEEIFGTPSLAHDDPTRQAMVALALAGPGAVAVSRLSTPTSPIPPARRSVAPSTTFPMVPPTIAPTATGYQDVAPPLPPISDSGASRSLATAKPFFSSNTWGIIGVAAALVILVASLMLTRRNGSGTPDPQTVAPTVANGGATADSGVRPDTTSVPAESPPPPASQVQPETQPIPAATVIVASVQLSPATAALAIGGRLRLSAQVSGSDGSTLRVHPAVAWRSLAPKVVAVTRDGELRALTAGRAIVTASVSGKVDSVVIEVAAPAATPATVASVSVAPDSITLAVGGSATLAATPRDAAGAALPGREVSWSSSSRIVTVSATGQVQGLTPGMATVTALSQGRAASVKVVVTPVAVATVTVTAPAAALKPGDTIKLAAVMRDAQGDVLSDRAVTWESSDPAVASVTGGDVTAKAAGTATITATSERRSGAARITVAVPADPTADRARALQAIDKLLGGFANGLNRRDIILVREAYAGMSAAEEQNWQAILTDKRLTRIQAAFEAVEPPKVEGSSASQRVRLKLQAAAAGQPATTSDSRYLAKFEQQGGVWKLTSLQPQ